MDKRRALSDNSSLKLGSFVFTIENKIGRGSSCIVYEASYFTNTGDKKLVRIKECYPLDGGVTRCAAGNLCAENTELFESCKLKMTETFRLENRLFYSGGLTDSLANTFDIYNANNSVYIVTAYVKDNTLSEYKPSTLKSCVSIVKQASITVGKLHREGFLYLDIKPENVLVVENSERIILFDFDSLLPIRAIQNEEYMGPLSYSRGFAAPEQRLGKLRQFGFYTDVYGIGALLFYLVFGRTPEAFDRENSAEYDFSKIRYPASYRDRLYFALRDFFRKTLANYRFDRYPDMEETVSVLKELERLSDVTVPYIISSRINRSAFFVGRGKELSALENQLENDNEYFFVCGIGGIGKTALVSELISRCRERFDGVVWLNYKGSMKRLICDDNAVTLNTVSRFHEKDEEENEEEYFLRKTKAIKQANEGKNILAVVDDFDNEKDISVILGLFHKVIFITRNDMKSLNCDCVYVSSINNKAELKALFEHNSNMTLKPYEVHFLDEITEKISAHTLTLELIAKQISCSFLNVEKAAEIVCKHGFTDIAPEKIGHLRDGVYYYDTLKQIISEVMEINRLSGKQIALLKIIGLSGGDGIEVRLLQRLCELQTLDEINLLIQSGWINQNNDSVFLHAVIREMVGAVPVSREDELLSKRVMSNLTTELNHAKGESSHWLYDLTEKLLSDCAALHGKEFARLSLAALKHCPIEYEENVIGQAEALLKTPKYFTVREIMDIYSNILDMCEAKNDYSAAEGVLKRIWTFAEKTCDNFVFAYYYDMAADFYNKRYGKGDVERCLKCCNKAIYYARQVDDNEARHILASNALFKSNVMMRNRIGPRCKVLSLLQIGEENCRRTAEPTYFTLYELYMTKARFCVTYERDESALQRHLLDAYKVIKELYPSDIGMVVHIILPAARLYYDFYNTEYAVKLLQKGLELCERHIELVPYIRLKQEINNLLKDITGA